MLANLLFGVGFLVCVWIGFLYFRDLGDVSQMVLKVRRENMLRFIRNEYRLLAIGLGAGLLAAVAHLGFGGGQRPLFWIMIILIGLFYAVPWVYVHLGLRNQMNSARYFPIAEAMKFIAPATGVVVIEKDGVARAHPDPHMMRPHMAGNADGLDGEDVVMTYCAMANLGVGYTPEIEGERLDLEVLAQHGNNLILRDNTTGEPIQHIYGHRDRGGPAMRPWPTFRMTFRGFARAYPDGTVFLNKPPSNPLLALFDTIMDVAFSWGIARQHSEAEPIMDNMTRRDDRMPAKTYVWGIDIDGDATCYTQEFVISENGPVNATVGGRAIVVAYHPEFESLGVWYNDTGAPVSSIDFFGQSDRGALPRADRLKAGLFWHVWAEFFPQTDINRTGAGEADKAA